MRHILTFLFSAFTVFFSHSLLAQFEITTEVGSGHDCFPISLSNGASAIYTDMDDAEVVHTVAEHFAQDVERVASHLPTLRDIDDELSEYMIIIGSIGQNKLIDQLIADKKLNVSTIKGAWERYQVSTISRPFEGVKKALVIVGSDRRGTAYGVFSLSEAIGVSPWYYWADVPVTPKKEIHLKDINYNSKAPSVKYRGIFLNDEDWGLKPWASALMDPQINDIGPNTYTKVFELVLRLKGNIVAPAMHECTGAFFKYPENKIVADRYAIMMTSSHAEPLLYNNTTEWHQLINGNWDYVENKEEVLNAMDSRVAEASSYENVYTVGMRGIHDTGMSEVPEGYTKRDVLAEVIDEERKILTKYIDQPVEDIQQIFVPYKEVLDIYESGMQLPDDITIVWPDDNYGYIKKLSNKEEQNRAGGAGVYYHISYLGWPNDYLWLNTTPPALMYAEMKKAYDLGADRYWLLNVGDIKPGEMGTELFLDMAWDFDAFSFENINDFQIDRLSEIFGDKYRDELTHIFERYYYHGFTRKPEYMTWDWAWNSIFIHPNIKDTELSYQHYDEAETRLREYREIADMASDIMSELPEELKASFYELVYYPVKGASLYNHKMLIAQKNRWYATQGRTLTNELAQAAESYHDSLALITAAYNNLLDAKWAGMMTAPGFLPTEHLAPTETINLKDQGTLKVFAPNNLSTDNQLITLPTFEKSFDESQKITIYNTGKKSQSWTAKSEEWILLSNKSGIITTQDEIEINIDWSKLSGESTQKGKISVQSGTTTHEIHINADPRSIADSQLYRAHHGVISIDPTDYHNKTEKGNIKFSKIPQLGYADNALQLGSAIYDSGEGSFVSYDFTVEEPGDITIHSYMLPLFAKDREHGTAYGIQIDDQPMITQSNDVKEYSREWASNVIRNSAINSNTFTVNTSGKHTLRIYAIDPGMILHKIVIDTGGLRDSYLGPPVRK